MIRGIKLLLALIFIGTFATTQASILDSVRPYESSEQIASGFSEFGKTYERENKNHTDNQACLMK